MAEIAIRQLTKRYGDKTVLDRISLTFARGGIYCIMAPSGRGKTTLLRLIAGLEKPDSGQITGIDTGRISMMFQDDRLVPFMSALENAALPIKDKAQAAEVLKRLGLSDSLDKPASRLSGGMARRVALARAMLADSDIILLDEPFTGLDADTREAAAKYVLESRRGRTVIAVTHSETEAGLLGADILRL